MFEAACVQIANSTSPPLSNTNVTKDGKVGPVDESQSSPPWWTLEERPPSLGGGQYLSLRIHMHCSDDSVHNSYFALDSDDDRASSSSSTSGGFDSYASIVEKGVRKNSSASDPATHPSFTDFCHRFSDDEITKHKNSIASVTNVTTNSSIALELTYFLLWSESYHTPVVYFTAAATKHAATAYGNSEMPSSLGNAAAGFRPTVQQLQRWVMPGICDPLTTDDAQISRDDWGSCNHDHRASFGRPIVSEGYCEELQRALFSVHPCDMETMLRLAATAGSAATADESGASSSAVHLTESSVVQLLRLCGPLLGVPSACLPFSM
jgi:hypothetical protein